jgi:hypothetical protein
MKEKGGFQTLPSSRAQITTYPAIDRGVMESVVWTEAIYNNIADRLLQQQRHWLAMERTQNQLAQFPIVENLYKYKAPDPPHPERIEKFFKDQTLWAPSIASLNDPLEVAFIIGLQDAYYSAVLADAMNMMAYSKWWGCISFTLDPVCPQMWAHYAASHSGFCIQYRRLDSLLLCQDLCRPVIYRRTMPELEDRMEAQNENMQKVFFTKSENWEYEREWRLMYPNADGYVAPGLLVPSGVVFGLRTTEESRAILRQFGEKLRFGQIVVSSEPYRLEIDWEEREHG